jgi:hypothetical protein
MVTFISSANTDESTHIRQTAPKINRIAMIRLAAELKVQTIAVVPDGKSPNNFGFGQV